MQASCDGALSPDSRPAGQFQLRPTRTWGCFATPQALVCWRTQTPCIPPQLLSLCESKPIENTGQAKENWDVVPTLL